MTRWGVDKKSENVVDVISGSPFTTLHVLEQVDPPEGVAPPDVSQRLELAPALGQVLRVHHVVDRLRASLLRLGQVGAQILKTSITIWVKEYSLGREVE